MGSVVVVGGGIAGLACAWRLSRAGHPVEVLEASSQPGGRYAAGGPADLELREEFDGRHDLDLLNLARQLGICDTRDGVDRAADSFCGERPLRPAELTVLRDGRLVTGRGRGLAGIAAARAIPTGARFGLIGHGLRSFALADRLGRARAEWLQRLDNVSLLADAVRVAGHDAATLLLGPLAEAFTGCPPDELSRVVAFERGLRWWWPGDRIRITGGMRRIVDALAGRVRVRRDCEVLAVESETDGARVRYRRFGEHRTALADGVVVAVSARHVPRLCAKLTPDEAGFFASVRYAPQVGVHFAVSAPPPSLGDGCLVLPRREGHAAGAIAITRAAAPEGSAVLSVWSASEMLASDLHEPDRVLVKRALRDVSRTPIGRIAPTAERVTREATAIPVFGVGHPTRLARFADRINRSPRLAFAGEYLVGAGVDGAVTSGMRAATSIGRDLQGSGNRG